MSWRMFAWGLCALGAGCSGSAPPVQDTDPAEQGEGQGEDSGSQGQEGDTGGSGGQNGSEEDPSGWTTLFREDFATGLGDHGPLDTFGSWTVHATEEWVVVASAADEGISAASGDHVMYVSTPGRGFGDNRIDRCVAIDGSKDLRFGYSVLVAGGAVDDEMRVRVNPYFYSDMDDCTTPLAIGENGDRLEPDGDFWYNDDWDVAMNIAGVIPGSWFDVTEATDGDHAGGEHGGAMWIPSAHIPPGAKVIRFSLRIRDRGFSDETPDRRIYVDDIFLQQAE